MNDKLNIPASSPPSSPQSAEAKKAAAKAAADFSLHVALVIRQDDVTKNKALFLAYCEGPKGLEKRLNPSDSPGK